MIPPRISKKKKEKNETAGTICTRIVAPKPLISRQGKCEIKQKNPNLRTLCTRNAINSALSVRSTKRVARGCPSSVHRSAPPYAFPVPRIVGIYALAVPHVA
eukprot:2626695-Rhodomonas_salina.2